MQLYNILRIKLLLLLFTLLNCSYFISEVVAQGSTNVYYSFKVHFNFGNKMNSFQIGPSIGFVFYENRHILTGASINYTLSCGYLGSNLYQNVKNDVNLSSNSLLNNFSLSLFFLSNISSGYSHIFRSRFKPFNNNEGNYYLNPYRSSIGLSSIFAMTNRSIQHIGSLHVKLQNINIGYFNDGPPFSYLNISDGKDRWWTGGGFIEYFDAKSQQILTFNFERFTGYSLNAFEISNLLLMNETIYQSNESFRNIGSLSIQYTDKNGISGNITFIGDYIFDVQNLIHKYITFDAIHKSIVKNSIQYGFGFQKH
jgi:hypothetical protein